MSVDAKLVRELRERTGAGMMDCKKALLESNGDLDLAVEFLRKSGIAKAEKKSVRDAKEGLIISYIQGQIWSVSCVDVSSLDMSLGRMDSFPYTPDSPGHYV